MLTFCAAKESKDFNWPQQAEMKKSVTKANNFAI